MLKQTPLFDLHIQAKAQMIDFAGWEMPLHFGSQISEHHQVRQNVGMFDVSHMGILDIIGTEAKLFLQYLLTNDVDKLEKDGQALYTCILNTQGGILDDLIVYRLHSDHYRLVCNAACFEKDLAWMHEQAERYQVQLQPRPDLAIIAIQGPKMISLLELIIPAAQINPISQLTAFTFFYDNGKLYSRTGYTGENGIECIIPIAEAIEMWQVLLKHGVQPCGLAARDTLRIEAGLNLYGQDMDEQHSPLDSNLVKTVSFQNKDRDFIGKQSLIKQQKQGITEKLTGIILQVPGVLRKGQRILTHEGNGYVTSGTFSPTLNKAIALVRVPKAAQGEVKVERRGELLPGVLVKPSFLHLKQQKN